MEQKLSEKNSEDNWEKQLYIKITNSLLIFIVIYIILFIIFSLLALMAGSFGKWVFVTAFIFTVIFSIMGILMAKDEEKLKSTTNNTIDLLKNIEGFNANKRFVSTNGEELIGIDEDKNRICIINKHKSIHVYEHKDVLECEIIEDGLTLTKTSRTGQIGGALIGAVVAGGVGAIIGGLSGQKSTTDRVKNISLKIVVNDTNKPYHIINFMNNLVEFTGGENKLGESKDNEKYKKAIDKANHWQSLISILIKRADEEEKVRNKQDSKVEYNPLDSNYVADELMKLSELYKQGILTKEELEKQKSKLIS